MHKQLIEKLINEKGRFQLPNDRETLFRGWFGNNMVILIMLLQGKNLRKETTIMRMQFFLFDLEHHFLNPRADHQIFRNEFRYLRYCLRVNPNTCVQHKERAMEMIAMIYEGLGLVCHLDFQERKEPVCMRVKDEVRRGIYEIFKTLCHVPAHC